MYSADANWGTRVPTSARFDPATVGLAAGAPLALGGRRKGPFCWQAYVAEEPAAAAADAGGSGGCCMK